MLSITDIKEKLQNVGYCPNEDILYAIYTQELTKRPLLIEGAPGVGKSSLAKAIADAMQIPFIRVQMYDGLTDDRILYDYDYQKQLLTLEAVKTHIDKKYAGKDVNDIIHAVAGDLDFYGRDFLIERPVLRAINGTGRKVLLFDEIDKASEETEYMLYEFLENYSITIPQYGEIICPEDQHPVVFLTSNHYRDLSDALKRRCNYLYIEAKTHEEMVDILRSRTNVNERLAKGIAACFCALSKRTLKQMPSVSEAIDYATYLGSHEEVTKEIAMQGLGVLAKNKKDIQEVRRVVAETGKVIWDE